MTYQRVEVMGVKILVVDDFKFNLTVAKDLLEAHVKSDGVILCKEPENVMGILSAEDVGIVLLDIIMPKIDGISLLKLIREKTEYKDLQIIMFTGISDKESFRQCFENGANDFINKPIEPTEFIVRIQAAVKARENLLKLQETQSYLVQSEKLASIGELAAGVAHEINNPIGFVSSNLEMVERYLEKIKNIIAEYRTLGTMIENTDVSRQDLAAMQRQIAEKEIKMKLNRVLEDFVPIIAESRDGVARVTRIVQSLRNFARTGREDEVALNDLNQIVDDALLILNNEIKFIASVEKDFQQLFPVKCEKGQVAQVLINILHNAAQAIGGQAREGLGKIGIRTYMEGEHAVCRIEDNGPGIKPEHLARIFDPFFTTKEVGSGTGLGLSISYGIIKKYAGELFAESEWGKGATFFIKLPVVKEG